MDFYFHLDNETGGHFSLFIFLFVFQGAPFILVDCGHIACILFLLSKDMICHRIIKANDNIHNFV